MNGFLLLCKWLPALKENLMAETQTKFYGFSELESLLLEISQEFGAGDATKNVLIPAAKKSMKVVLQAAKNNLRPGHGEDTGQLKRTLRVTARAVRPKDLRSKYVKKGDVVIATVSAKLVKKFVNDGKGGVKNIGDVSDGRAMFVEYGTKNKNMSVNVEGLSRKAASAVQREFGTVRMEARPYLRPALQANQTEVTENLRTELKTILENYRSKRMG